MNLILDPKNSGQTDRRVPTGRTPLGARAEAPRLRRPSLFVPLLALWCATLWPCGSTAQTARLVRGDFQNELSLNAASNSPAANSSSVAMFSGHVVQSSTNGVPTNSTGSLVLMESSFGQPFATDLPFPDFIAVTVSNALAYLYPPPSATRAELETGGTAHWAFRYQ